MILNVKIVKSELHVYIAYKTNKYTVNLVTATSIGAIKK